MSQAVEADKQAIDPLLDKGYTVIVSDIEGRTADFAAGPEYGMATPRLHPCRRLDPGDRIARDASIRAAGYPAARSALCGGGARAGIRARRQSSAHRWPPVNSRQPGPQPAVCQRQPGLGRVIPMAVIGVGRSHEVDLMPHLSLRQADREQTRYVHISGCWRSIRA